MGQIRSRIEMDFFCAGEVERVRWAFQGLGQTYCPRLRQAYGEWDMTPNWTFLAGQTDQIETLSIIGVTLVDNSTAMPASTAAPASHRSASTYHDGPLTWAVAMERPEEASDTLIPGVGSFLQYDIAGGHQFIVAGGISDINSDPLQHRGRRRSSARVGGRRRCQHQPRRHRDLHGWCAVHRGPRHALDEPARHLKDGVREY